MKCIQIVTSKTTNSKMSYSNSTQSISDLVRISGHIYIRLPGCREEIIEEQLCLDGRVLDEDGIVVTDNDDDERRVLHVRVKTRRRIEY